MTENNLARIVFEKQLVEADWYFVLGESLELGLVTTQIFGNTIKMKLQELKSLCAKHNTVERIFAGG